MCVKASSDCAKIVHITETNTQNTLRPVLSMTKPNRGLAPADIIYTNELTKFASAGGK